MPRSEGETITCLKVDGDGMDPAQVWERAHRSRTWTSDVLEDIIKKVLMD